MSERECGECQVCCELPQVEPLGKAMFTRCKHQCAAGCGIYEERPEPCRAFACAWLRGDRVLEDDDRPDRLGLMVETCHSEGPGQPALPYLHVWEVRPGALQASLRAMELLDHLLSVRPVRLQRYQARSVWGPSGEDAPPLLAIQALELRRRHESGEGQA